MTQARPKRPSIGLLLKLVVKDLAFHRAAKLVGSNPGQGWEAGAMVIFDPLQLLGNSLSENEANTEES